MTTEKINEIIEKGSLKVEEADEYIRNAVKLRIFSRDVLNIIKATGDIEYMRKCAQDSNIELKGMDRVDLLLAIGDRKLIKQCLQREDLELYSACKVILIKSLKDPEEIIECLIGDKLMLISSEKVDIILSAGNPEFILKCLKNQALGLYTSDKLKLVSELKDKEMIKRVLKDKTFNINEVEVIKILGDLDYAKQCLRDKDVGLRPYQKVAVIKYINDVEFTKECIKAKDLDIDLFGKVELIKAIGDKNYTKQCAMDNEIGLDSENKVELLKSIKDPEEIEECIRDEELGLTTKEKLLLAFEIEDKELVEEIIGQRTKATRKIKLPEEMTFGIEIETEGISLVKNLFNDWKAIYDNSLEDGTEFVSPPLKATEANTEEIYFMCDVIRCLEANSSERCGGHVHIGSAYLTTLQSYVNLIELYSNAEEIIYVISNREGEIPRNQGPNKYAIPLSGKIENAIQAERLQLTNSDEFILQLQEAQGGKFSSLNLKNVDNLFKRTIEFRMSNGTINPDTWIENINLFGGIVSAAEKLQIIQSKPEENRTDEESKYLASFDVLKEDVSSERKLQALLELTIAPEEQDVYVRRYQENSRLLEKNDTTLSRIRTKVAKNPISIKDIGRKVFTGKDAVSGIEIQEAETRLNNDIRTRETSRGEEEYDR